MSRKHIAIFLLVITIMDAMIVGTLVGYQASPAMGLMIGCLVQLALEPILPAKSHDSVWAKMWTTRRTSQLGRLSGMEVRTICPGIKQRGENSSLVRREIRPNLEKRRKESGDDSKVKLSKEKDH